MGEGSSVIFNKKASEKLRSADDLDKYVRVTNPSVWLVLFACIALLVGLFAWGVFGSVTTSVSSTGVVVNGKAFCFLSVEDAAKVHVDDIANVGGEGMRVKEISTLPLSREETDEVISSDYLVSTLVTEDWVYQITFEGETTHLASNVPIGVSITVERIPPISLLLRSNA